MTNLRYCKIVFVFIFVSSIPDGIKVVKQFYARQVKLVILFCIYSVLMETEPQAVVNRCALRTDELTFGDQSISQVGMSVRMS